jgi:hypothetical protein
MFMVIGDMMMIMVVELLHYLMVITLIYEINDFPSIKSYFSRLITNDTIEMK